MKLAKHNIPFYTFIINDEYTIITDVSDTNYISRYVTVKLGIQGSMVT
jgi:hypothetical protein